MLYFNEAYVVALIVMLIVTVSILSFIIYVMKIKSIKRDKLLLKMQKTLSDYATNNIGIDSRVSDIEIDSKQDRRYNQNLFEGISRRLNKIDKNIQERSNNK